MSITYHERPGVYSDYDASSIVAVGTAQRVIALIGTSSAKAGVYTLTSYAGAQDVFGAESQLGKMLKLAYQNGAGTVLAYPVAEDSAAAYSPAVSAILAEKQASLCVLGSALEAVQTAFCTALSGAAQQKGECIGFCSMGAATAAQLGARAQKLNCERVVFVGPQVYVTGETAAQDGCMAAAALAGALAAERDPALPLSGLELQGLTGVTAVYSDTEYDALVAAGVTALECEGGRVQVIRALTTRSKTGGSADKTYRELTTMLILDELIPAIRTALRTKFAHAKNNVLTRKAIRNQVVLELEERVEREIIEGYDKLTVTAAQDDRTTCVVEFEFTVVQGLNRILLTAHMNV